jgi:hypothetical protein
MKLYKDWSICIAKILYTEILKQKISYFQVEIRIKQSLVQKKISLLIQTHQILMITSLKYVI